MRIAVSMMVPLLPSAAGAQSKLEVHPSVTLAEVHDDNVFATAEEPVADDITRLGPGIVVARTSPRLWLQARYRLEAERYRHQRASSAPAPSFPTPTPPPRGPSTP